MIKQLLLLSVFFCSVNFFRTSNAMFDLKVFVPNGTPEDQLCPKAQSAVGVLNNHEKFLQKLRDIYFGRRSEENFFKYFKELNEAYSDLNMFTSCNAQRDCKCKFNHKALEKTLKLFWIDEQKND